MTTDDFEAERIASIDLPSNQLAAVEVGAAQIAEAVVGSDDSTPDNLAPFGKGYLWALYIGWFAIYIAFVTPIAFSLAIRVEQVAPDAKDSALALAAGIPGIFAIVLTPLIGALSDRTRSRLGRRRPWMIAGLTLGLVGSLAVGLAPNASIVVVGWTLAYVGYTAASSMTLAHLGDKLPENQRGKVLGITGAISQMAPLAGVLVGGALSSNGLAMFAIPAILAFLGSIVFLVRMKDDARTEKPVVTSKAVEARKLLVGMVFNPRRYPNLGWVWLSKALIFFALSFSSLYTVYFIASRFGLEPLEVAGMLGIAGILGVGAGVGGAIGSGILSDKFGTRKPFLIAAAFIMAGGLVVTALSTSIPMFLIGNAISALATGVYGAVDQALALDVLPREEDENGRFLGILQLGSTVPQAFGPLVAGLILATFGGEYASVYFGGAILAILGAIAIIPITVGRRAELPTTSLQVPTK
ncbi:MFS transporter [Pseudoclavibacter sp. RFBJ3]|uniref:MFS transporter n=1 Tax=unclassified Pseudoclavibacter TaxID=2615177 RepID=UPI000CE92E23|nr:MULTISPECIES: MFS transporter [unclassified Pseudoclavibacter]PPF87288.1 MFS transporter [Pseudoclavibacter sp. RFBJ5]PPF90292.1 MFS transporter [Pseudoclavibacter sp. RFBJ3]PPG00810.1 MFS transporter [Pseudoclavibacter sp. RFBH5]PPG26078.1 MFS transporter [Pseudoclavibacter sp. RFBI4]